MEKEAYFEEEYSPRGSTFKRLTLMFDGSCGPTNPDGNVGVGYAIFNSDDGCVVAEGWGYRVYSDEWDNSNNVAEWRALERGVDLLQKCGYTYDKLFVQGDSKLVINQVKGVWRIKEGRYYEVATRTMSEHRDVLRGAEVSHVYREQNEYCDHLSNRYIDYLKNSFGVDTGGEFKKPTRKQKQVKRKRGGFRYGS